jgi:signal transduction histidine kinase
MLALTTILVLLTVVVFLVLRNLRHKLQSRQKALSQIALESQLRASEALLKGEEMERERVARDLHDSLGALLSGIKFSFQHMKDRMEIPRKNKVAYNKGLAMLDASVEEVRRIAHNMMPANLLKFGLDSALRDVCDQLNLGSDLTLSYQSVGLEESQLGQARMLSIYRIIQELLANLVRHSGASHAILQLIQDGGQLTITVEDNGLGFDPKQAEAGNGIGWKNIRNRVRLLGADLEVQSSPGKGTTVEIRLTL